MGTPLPTPWVHPRTPLPGYAGHRRRYAGHRRMYAGLPTARGTRLLLPVVPGTLSP